MPFLAQWAATAFMLFSWSPSVGTKPAKAPRPKPTNPSLTVSTTWLAGVPPPPFLTEVVVAGAFCQVRRLPVLRHTSFVVPALAVAPVLVHLAPSLAVAAVAGAA